MHCVHISSKLPIRQENKVLAVAETTSTSPEQLQDNISALRAPPMKQHLTDCSQRFASKRSLETVKPFIDSVMFYKITEGMTDINVLKELSLLLEGPAQSSYVIDLFCGRSIKNNPYVRFMTECFFIIFQWA